MKFILTHFLCFISLHLSAQNCNTEILLQTLGNWRPSPQGSASGLSAADLAREKKIVATLHSMIQSKYSPMGLQASFLGSYGREYANMPGNYYGYSIAPYTFYCDGNMVKTKIDTYNDFFINANLFEGEIYDTTNENTGTGEGHYSMSNLPEYKDGIWLFKEIDQSLGIQITGKKSSWLITYNNQLPFAYVTKREFLEKRKRILAAQKLSMKEVFIVNLKNIEIEKKYKEVEFKNDPVNLEKYMRMDYSDSKKLYEKLLADNEKEFKPAFDKIDAQLKMPLTVLSEQAIVKIDPTDHLSYLFTNDDDGFGKILIKPNPGYFNKKLPKSSPQFFFVSVIHYDKEPVSVKFREDIVNAIDFTALKNMLGK
jgi:hypothetical protein